MSWGMIVELVGMKVILNSLDILYTFFGDQIVHCQQAAIFWKSFFEQEFSKVNLTVQQIML
jgi:hypothetical protein